MNLDVPEISKYANANNFDPDQSTLIGFLQLGGHAFHKTENLLKRKKKGCLFRVT